MTLGYKELKLLGRHLADCRRAAEKTQLEVSMKLGYGTSQYVSNIERGISTASNDHLRVLMKFYKIPKHQFIKLIQSLYSDRIKRVLS